MLSEKEIIQALERMSAEDPNGFSSDILSLIDCKNAMLNDRDRYIKSLKDDLSLANEDIQMLKAEIERSHGLIEKKALAYDRVAAKHADELKTAKIEAITWFAGQYKDQVKNYTGMFDDDGCFYVSLQAVLNAVDFIKEKMAGDV